MSANFDGSYSPENTKSEILKITITKSRIEYNSDSGLLNIYCNANLKQNKIHLFPSFHELEKSQRQECIKENRFISAISKRLKSTNDKLIILKDGENDFNFKVSSKFKEEETIHLYIDLHNNPSKENKYVLLNQIKHFKFTYNDLLQETKKTQEPPYEPDLEMNKIDTDSESNSKEINHPKNKSSNNDSFFSKLLNHFKALVKNQKDEKVIDLFTLDYLQKNQAKFEKIFEKIIQVFVEKEYFVLPKKLEEAKAEINQNITNTEGKLHSQINIEMTKLENNILKESKNQLLLQIDQHMEKIKNQIRDENRIQMELATDYITKELNKLKNKGDNIDAFKPLYDNLLSINKKITGKFLEPLTASLLNDLDTIYSDNKQFYIDDDLFNYYQNIKHILGKIETHNDNYLDDPLISSNFHQINRNIFYIGFKIYDENLLNDIKKNYDTIKEIQELKLLGKIINLYDKIDMNKILQLQKQLNYLMLTEQQPFKNQSEFKTKLEEIVSEYIFPLAERLNSEVFSKKNAQQLKNFIFDKAGIETISIDCGKTRYDSTLHNILVETNDRNYNHLIVTKVIEPGYQIKWSGKILKKVGISVNYR